ncbi:E3 ubiquitin-protein ligase SMURF2-like [Artemia franciscana]|uniref:E3 ubiquitin-protein ligase SMURF2-like n=1 Tax=Artemia franciscana TaxID=6661 RepID=UPI0032DB9CEF
MTSSSRRSNGGVKLRLTILCAKNLAKKDLFRLPDPFARVSVDGSGQTYSTHSVKSTLDPKWNQHFDLFIGKGDCLTISVWNHRKVMKKEGSGFLGCVRLLSSSIQRLKDTGYQRLELTKAGADDSEAVRGTIVVSLLSRDAQPANSLAIADPLGNLSLTNQNHSEPVNEDQTASSPTSPSRSEDGSSRSSSSRRRVRRGSTVGVAAGVSVSAEIQLSRDKRSQSTRERRRSHQELPSDNVDGVGSSSNRRRNNESSTPSRRSGESSREERRRTSRSSRQTNRVPSVLVNENAVNPIVDLPDGYEMRTTPQGQVYFLHVPTGASTWYDPRLPREIRDSSQPLTSSPLPPGWEARHTPSGRIYFVDHNNRTTQFTDPRFSLEWLRNYENSQTEPVLQPERDRLADPPPPLPPASVTDPMSSPSNQPCSGDIRRSRSFEPTQDGRAQAVSANPEPDRPVTRCGSGSSTKSEEEPLPKYKRDLVAKIKVLRNELLTMQPQSGHCRIEVSRQEIFEDSYRIVMKLRPKDLRKRLMVRFKGEEGLDYGGVAREWLHLLSKQMLNPAYGLFQYVREDNYILQINSESGVNPEHLSYFHFVGRTMGMAVFHGHHLDGGFTMPFYKLLLNKPVTLEDIAAVDPGLHRSLSWLLDNPVSDVVETTFSVETDSFGMVKVHDLKANGRNIPVTDENKKEYVKLYVSYRFMRGTEQQFLSLQKGFFEVVAAASLKPFDEKELELLICGISKIDVFDWKANTRLKHCTPETPVVQWFWQIVDDYPEDMRARLLQFVTGSSRVPLQGFKALQGATGAAGPRLFTLHVVDTPVDHLPKAHTCFNRLDLPAYENRTQMYDKLTQAVEETCGFLVE